MKSRGKLGLETGVVYDSPVAAKKFEILVLNQISQVGLKRFPEKGYKVSKDAAHPDAILVRSHEMNAMKVPESVRAIGRAGAGTNNIPVKEMSGRGVPVFNAPGANANAVKELVLAGMLIAARNLAPALDFVRLQKNSADLEKKIEEGSNLQHISNLLRNMRQPCSSPKNSTMSSRCTQTARHHFPRRSCRGLIEAGSAESQIATRLGTSRGQCRAAGSIAP